MLLTILEVQIREKEEDETAQYNTIQSDFLKRLIYTLHYTSPSFLFYFFLSYVTLTG